MDGERRKNVCQTEDAQTQIQNKRMSRFVGTLLIYVVSVCVCVCVCVCAQHESLWVCGAHSIWYI